MAKQFGRADCSRGAPIGRAEYGQLPTETKSVRLFTVRLDSGGYDDGGAYWGIGQRLYCATDDRDYRRFVRAMSRAEAAAKLSIPVDRLKRGISLQED